MELSIDTSSINAGIALSNNETVLAELTWRCEKNHSVELLPSVDKLMAMMKVDRVELTGIIITKGPGSFNGLRVGMAVAKGLAYSLKIPLAGISTLEAEAFPYISTGLPVCSIHNAGRGEIAVALFKSMDGQMLRIIEEQITSIEGLKKYITRETIVCGEISFQLAEVLKETFPANIMVIPGSAMLHRAGIVAELGWRRLKKGDTDDPASLQPLYLRHPPITEPKSKSGVAS